MQQHVVLHGTHKYSRDKETWLWLIREESDSLPPALYLIKDKYTTKEMEEMWEMYQIWALKGPSAFNPACSASEFLKKH